MCASFNPSNPFPTYVLPLRRDGILGVHICASSFCHRCLNNRQSARSSENDAGSAPLEWSCPDGFDLLCQETMYDGAMAKEGGPGKKISNKRAIENEVEGGDGVWESCEVGQAKKGKRSRDLIL